MGSHAQGDYADTVSDEFVKEVCPHLHKTLMEYVEYAGLDMAQVSFGLDDLQGYDALDGADEKDEQNIRDALNALIAIFKKNTGVDLVIRHIESEGRNDEVDGFFWGVEKIYQLTPAAKKIEDKITRKHWTTFG